MNKIITLLDGTEYLYKDIKKKLDDDEFYYGELGKNALSSSSIKLLVDSPKKYYYVTNYASLETQGLRDGRLLQTIGLMLLLKIQKHTKKRSKNTASHIQKKNVKMLNVLLMLYLKTKKQETF